MSPLRAADTVPPAAVTDLAASIPSISPQLHATLSWTAPGNDGTNGGPAATYTLRYRTDAAVTDANWASATSVSGLASPGAPGASESFTVVGLKPNTRYHWALKTADSASNTSPISNSPSQLTAKYEGFGYQAVGGGEKPIFHVTSLADSGPGTLRDAVSTGNRYIVFDVGGTIALQTLIDTRATASSFITVDGSTAPAPGITIRPGAPLNDGWRLGNQDNVIITYLRLQGLHTWTGPDATDDLMTTNATTGNVVSNLVWDHLTVRNVGDSAMDIWNRLQDATISHCLIVFNKHPMTSGNDAPSARITIHHNLWGDNGERQPQIVGVHRDLEIVNNVLYHWAYNPHPGAGYTLGSYAIRIRNSPAGATDANILNNYFLSGTSRADSALVYGSGPGPDVGEEDGPTTCMKQGSVFASTMGQLWVAGNVFPSQNCDEYSTVTGPRPVPAGAHVTTDLATSLWSTVLPDSGTRFRASDEQSLVDEVGLAIGGGGSCGNNVRDAGEVCDGTDLAGATCASVGFGGGTLRCAPNCGAYDSGACTNNPADVINVRRTDRK